MRRRIKKKRLKSLMGIRYLYENFLYDIRHDIPSADEDEPHVAYVGPTAICGMYRGRRWIIVDHMTVSVYVEVFNFLASSIFKDPPFVVTVHGGLEVLCDTLWRDTCKPYSVSGPSSEIGISEYIPTVGWSYNHACDYSRHHYNRRVMKKHTMTEILNEIKSVIDQIEDKDLDRNERSN